MWLGRFGDRARRIALQVSNWEEVKDKDLEVRVYVPGEGIVSHALHTLLEDPEWRNDAVANKRNQCEILDHTFLAAPIYRRLQEMVRK